MSAMSGPDTSFDPTRLVDTVDRLQIPNPHDLLGALNELADVSNDSKSSVALPVPRSEFIRRLRSAALHATPTIRAAALRTLRHFAVDGEFLDECVRQHVHLILVRSLEREKSGDSERFQAFKLLRRLVEVDCDRLPPHLVHLLVALAGATEEATAREALALLVDVALGNPRVSAQCGAIKTLLLAVLDPTFSLQEGIVQTLLSLLGDSDRRYVRRVHDVGVLLAPLVDNFNSKESAKDRSRRWSTSLRAVVTMLKSWTGLICLVSHPLGIRVFVEALRLPSPELHDLVLDALFDLLRLPQERQPANPFSYAQQQRLRRQESADLLLRSQDPAVLRAVRRGRPDLAPAFTGAVLVALVDGGLIEGLVELGSRRQAADVPSDADVAQKATLLLGELLFLANSLLPAVHCARMQSLPVLVDYAASVTLDPRTRALSSSMVANLHQFHHLKTGNTPSKPPGTSHHQSLTSSGGVRGEHARGGRMDEVKVKVESDIDVDQLKLKMQDSQVTATKDYVRWKWDAVADLLEGPLSNPALLAYAAAKTDFVKKLLWFFKPSSKAFSRMPLNEANTKFIRLGVVLLESLVSTESGADEVGDSRLLQELADLLRAEREAAQDGDDARTRDERVLSAERLPKSLAKGYFDMVSTLSRLRAGCDLLLKSDVFRWLLELASLPDRIDLAETIAHGLDYSIAGEARNVLGRLVASPRQAIRLLAVKHLLTLYRRNTPDFAIWGIDLLVRALGDSDGGIVQLALRILDEACDDTACLDALIRLRPNLLSIENGKDLYLRFLSRNQGFKLLQSSGFLETERLLWDARQNYSFAEAIEASLQDAFFGPAGAASEARDSAVPVPPHFYGELARCRDGSAYIRELRVVPSWLALALDGRQPRLVRSAALWALGVVCSADADPPLVDKDVVSAVVSLAHKESSLPIRGTAFYALCLMSRSAKSRELLDRQGWSAPANPALAICLPKDTRHSPLFKFPEAEYRGSPATATFEFPRDSDPARQEILSAVGSLTNFVTSETASRNLRRLKTQTPEHFADPRLMYAVLQAMGAYKFRPAYRRLLHELFDDALRSPEQLTAWDAIASEALAAAAEAAATESAMSGSGTLSTGEMLSISV